MTQGETPADEKRGVTYEAVIAMVADLPLVEQSTSYGTPALKVKGKLLLRLREDGDLAVHTTFADRDLWIAYDRNAFFTSDHYLNYPYVLVHPDQVRPRELRSLLRESWRMLAPKRVLAAYDAAHPPSEDGRPS